MLITYYAKGFLCGAFFEALLNKSDLDKTAPTQSFPQAVRTLSGIPARVILFNAWFMAIASPTCTS